jgi:ribosome recycling factor
LKKAIHASGLGLTPSNDGRVIRLPIPPLTEERRKELVKVVKKMAEDSRVVLRNIRRDHNESLKKLEKDKLISQDDLRILQKKLQDIIDEEIKKVDEILAKKEKEILEQ